MSDVVKIALIGGGFSIAGLVVSGILALMLKKIITKVDGTQTRMLAANTELSTEVKTLTGALAGLAGELRGRDYTRAHMEERADTLAEKATS